MYIIRYMYKGMPKKSVPIDRDKCKEVVILAKKVKMQIRSISFVLSFGNEEKEVLLFPPVEKITL